MRRAAPATTAAADPVALLKPIRRKKGPVAREEKCRAERRRCRRHKCNERRDPRPPTRAGKHHARGWRMAAARARVELISCPIPDAPFPTVRDVIVEKKKMFVDQEIALECALSLADTVTPPLLRFRGSGQLSRLDNSAAHNSAALVVP